MFTFIATIAGAVLLIAAHRWLSRLVVNRQPDEATPWRRIDSTQHETLSPETINDVQFAIGDGPVSDDECNAARQRLFNAAGKANIETSRFTGPGRWAGIAEATRKANARWGRKGM